MYPVGRLDWASEGLLVLTNDGALANALMKASSNVPKTYVVKVAGQPDEGKLDKLRAGVSIAEKGGHRVRTAPARIRLIREADNPWLEVTIIEGRNRQVRKMFEEVGHHVEKIRRVQYGPLSLDVPPGEFRSLTLEEVSRLKAAAAGKPTYVPKPMVLPNDKPRGLKPSLKVANRAFEGVRPPTARPFAKPAREFKPRRDSAARDFRARPAANTAGESRPKRDFSMPTERPQGPKPLKSFADRRSEAARYPKGRPFSKPSRDFNPRRDAKPRGDFRSRPGVVASGEGRPQRDFRPRRERPQGVVRPLKSFVDRRAEAPSHPKAPRDFKPRHDAKPRRDFRSRSSVNSPSESRPKRAFRPPSARPQGLKPPESFSDRSAEALRHPKAKRDFKPRRDSKAPRNFKAGPRNKSRFSPKG